jgi:NADH dehydrogenase
MHRVVIIGGGFGGMAAAQELERLLRPDDAEIVLLSRENFTLFTPMLPEVASGALDVRHVVTPIRGQLRRTRFVLANVEAMSARENTVTYSHVLTGDRETISYDRAIVAVGSRTSTFGLPGVAERVFGLKTLEDAGVLRNRYVWLLELADAEPEQAERKRLLTIVIVGGGFTGVEAAGETIELFRSVARFYPRVSRSDIDVVLIEGGKTLLPGLPGRMGSYSQRDLQRRGVRVLLGDGVGAADDGGLTLQSGARIETRTVVWSAGVAPAQVDGTQELPRGRHGTIAVEPTMQVSGYANIWAVGDCAAIPDGAGGYYPPTAQHAIREGPVLARNLVAAMRGRPQKPFRYRTLGMMASLGARKAVAQLPGDRVLTGFPAWFLWRSYYLSRLPGLDRKLRVAFDWTLDLLFPRDISELRVYSGKAPDMLE